MVSKDLSCKDETPFRCLEQFRRIEERLAAIQAQMESGLTEIRTIYDSYGKRLDRVEKTLFGDGNTGLCTKVSAILWVVSGVAAFVGVLVANTVASIFR